MTIIKILLLLLSCILMTTGFSQIENNIQIGQIEKWNEFEKMTLFETESHRLMEVSYAQTDSLYNIDSLYLPSLSDEEKKYYYEEYNLKLRINYKENRSRYFVNYFRDSINYNNTYSNEDTISTECSCELRNDSIRIQMGIWIFGGFFYLLELSQDQFQLTYIEDDYKNEQYKYTINDTITTSQLVLQVENSFLTLDEAVIYEVGEQLNGYIKFESPTYYIDTDYPDKSGKNNLKSAVTKGEIYFTCTIREPFDPPEE